MVNVQHFKNREEQLFMAAEAMKRLADNIEKQIKELKDREKTKRFAGSMENDMTLTIIRKSGKVEKIRDKRGILIR